MQSIAIFLRNDPRTNRFRRAILGTLRCSTVDTALMCSGFFQDDGKYSAGSDIDVITHRSSALALTTLGLYSYSWKIQYDDFINQLMAKNRAPHFSVTKKRIPGMGWHAKVFIAKRGPDPVVAVIGSSNITRRAFGEFAPFNYECDVVMWEESDAHINSAIEGAIGDAGGDNLDVVVSTYRPDHRANRQPLQNRLRVLEAELQRQAVDA